MKYLAAYCLAALAGKDHPGANDITAILKSVGIEPQQDHVNQVIEALKGKNLHEVIAQGLTKVSSLSVGGGSGAAKTEAPKKEAAKEAPKKEEKKEVPKEEPKEEADVDMGGLFDF